MIAKVTVGLCAFAAAYAVINWYMLIHGILYRLAVADYVTAATRFGVLALQAACLLVATVLLPRRYVGLLFGLAFASAWLNLGYGLILDEVIDPGQLSWLISETGQASAAAREFVMPVIGGMLVSLLGIALLYASRKLLRPHTEPIGYIGWIGGAALVLPVLALDLTSQKPVGAERNGYVYLAQLATAEAPPERGQVEVRPAAPPVAEKIVWLIDESIVHSSFVKRVLPMAMPFDPVDFGEAHAFSNCSSPSNVALRSGVDVVRANPKTDLRRTPSIWGYAREAGFRTTLIDAQSSGPLQNLILPPERSLIDRFVPAKNGLKSDIRAAERINALLRAPGRDFIYVVLNGAHFQYRDNYPKGLVPDNAPIALKYETAVRYSKDGFFPALLTGVDRDRVAVFYTSDHGQNVASGVVPHCSVEPNPKEFSVPLMAFLPPAITEPYRSPAPGKRSHSQIFPTSLELMGYARTHAETFDADLKRPSKRIIWFGRNVTPLKSGDPIDLHDAP